MTLDATGLSIPSKADIIAAMSASIRAAIGPQVQLGADSATGQVIEASSAQIAEAYEGLQELYDAQSPDSASGAQLDGSAAWTGITRNPATKSIGTLTITGTPTTVVPISSIYRVPAGPRFLTTVEVTIPGGGSIDVGILAETAGALSAAADTITEDVTIIAGVDSVTNAADTVPGTDIESDELLRQRRESSTQIIGAGTDGSISARLGEIDTVQQALVVSNRTNTTDEFGIPPHSFEAVIWPAQTNDQPIWDVVFLTQSAGIEAFGSIAGTAVDAQGISQPVAYSLAIAVDIHIEVVLTVSPTLYGDSDAAVKAAVEAFTANPFIGADLLLHKVEAAVDDAAAGILTITVLAKVGSAPGPSDDANIPINPIEIYQVDSADIDVTST